MKNYFKKFSIMFVMALVLVFGSCVSAFADDNTYTDNLIPKMTNNTTPNGLASASSTWSSNYDAYKAFNKAFYPSDTYWSTSAGTNFPQWISYKFPTAKKISKYTITNIQYGDITRAPKDWQFQGSNDGITWTTLDTQTIISFTSGEKKAFTFTNTTPYIYYRIYITANNGNTSETDIDEIEMMEKLQNIDESIALNKATINLISGDSETLTATTTPSAVGVTWKSSDESIATVDTIGKVTAHKEGQATIIANTADGSNLSASCTINVIKKDATEPTIPTDNSGGITNIINIARAKGDNTNNAGGEVTIIFNGVADTTLSVVKTADVKSVWVGDIFTYTIVVTNTGSKTAKAVVINDSAPNHIDFTVDGITTTQGKVDQSSTSKNIIVNVGDIPPLGTVTIKIPVTVIL